ncbi:MAG: ferric reductase-like transmembrane domain-containing protein [Miltoncostaeaceae bacterium]
MPFWWVLARASGVAAYVLLAAAMVAGIASRSRLVQRAASPVAKLEWHRLLAVLALAMTLVHGLALVMDEYVVITPVDLVVPGYVDYRPLWVAAGVLSLWLMVIVSVTASMRKHLGAGVWKPLHLGSYGAFTAGLVHGVMAGTDSGRPWMVALYLGTAALLVALVSRRLLAGPNAPLKRKRTPATAPAEPVSS